MGFFTCGSSSFSNYFTSSYPNNDFCNCGYVYFSNYLGDSSISTYFSNYGLIYFSNYLANCYSRIDFYNSGDFINCGSNSLTCCRMPVDFCIPGSSCLDSFKYKVFCNYGSNSLSTYLAISWLPIELLI